MKFELTVNVFVRNPELQMIQDIVLKTFHKVSKMATGLDSLTQEVAAMGGAIDSAVTLIVGFEAKLNEIIAAGNNDPALVQFASDLAAQRQRLADAVAANPIPV